MEPRIEPVPTSDRSRLSIGSGVGTTVAIQNRVLRNTYWLLSLSMLPTIAGAYVGMSLNFTSLYVTSPIMTPLLMFAAMMGMLFLVTVTRNSGWGVVSLFGFTFVAGVFLGPILQFAAGLKNGGQLVALAGGMTAAVFFTMATIATVTKRDFSFLGKFLFIGLVILLVASLANLFFQVPAIALTISAVAVLLFSLFLLYDLSRIVQGGETNYIMATLSLFLNLYNIFISLLNLLLAFSGQRD